MMEGDDAEAARQQAEAFQDQRVVHAWDPDRCLSHLYAESLKLRGPAWDVYFLYAPGVVWSGNETPEPTFWMHQLPSEIGADGRLLLDPGRFAQETLHLLGNGTESKISDLALRLHAKALVLLKTQQGQYSLEEIAKAGGAAATDDSGEGSE